MSKMVTEAGFYDGKYRKAGQYHSGPASDDIADDDGKGDATPFGKMPKDELLTEASARGIEVNASATKAEIIAALGNE